MTPVQKLYDLLKSLQSILDQLAVSLQRERSDIIKLETASLVKEGGELVELFARVDQLNPEIKATVSEACIAASVSGEHTISNLLNKLPKSERDLITKLQFSVKISSEAINNALAVNRNLLNDSLQFTSQSMQMFTNALRQTSSTTYGQQGRFVDAPDQPHIICKEI